MSFVQALWEFISSSVVWSMLATGIAGLALFLNWQTNRRVRDQTGIDYDLDLNQGVMGEVVMGRLSITNRRTRPIRTKMVKLVQPKVALRDVGHVYDPNTGKAFSDIGQEINHIDLSKELEDGESDTIHFGLIYKKLPPDGSLVVLKLFDEFHASQRRPNVTRIEGRVKRHPMSK